MKYKYYTSGNMRTAWRLVAFSMLGSSLYKAFRDAQANWRGGTSSQCLPRRFITAALSDRPLNGHTTGYWVCAPTWTTCLYCLTKQNQCWSYFAFSL